MYRDEYDIDWARAVRERHSIRTFTGEPLPSLASEMIRRWVRYTSESGVGKYRLILTASGASEVVGTYGMVRRAVGFMAIVTNRNVEDAAMWAARAVEPIVLRLVDAGVGTCWLGATYHTTGLPLGADEKVAAVVAYGLPARAPHLLHRLTSTLAGCRNRRPFEQLFDVPEEGRCRQALELVRMAPSALNKQPWRAVETQQAVHFYCTGASQMNGLDMGIAMAHFELAAPPGSWKVEDAPQMRGCRYVISYVFGAGEK